MTGTPDGGQGTGGALRQDPEDRFDDADAGLLDALMRFQASLVPSELAAAFAEEAEARVRLDGLTVALTEEPASHRSGAELGDELRYSLRDAQGEEIGEVRAYRVDRFTRADGARLARLVELVQLPLGNAIRYSRMRQQALRDGLTGLYNGEALRDALQREVDLAQRHQDPLALVVLDVDGFKEINDSNGHRAGDRVLTHLAEILRKQARYSDLIFRYGGDEMVVCLNRAAERGATVLARRILASVEAAPVFHDGCVISFAVSIGVARLRPTDTAETLFDRADAAMYRAKRRGVGLAVARR